MITIPKVIKLGDKIYHLVFTKSIPQQQIWEYTTDGENVNDRGWYRLVTVLYMKTSAPVERWALAIKQSLENTRPQPHYDLFIQGEAFYARIIYPPQPGNTQWKNYESNVWIAKAVCNGIVSLQFARQYAADPSGNDAGQLQNTRRDIDSDMTALQAASLKPECR